MNISIDVLNILKRISYNNISNTILNISSELVECDYDYIVATDDKNIVGFLTKKKIEEIANSVKTFTVNSVRNLTHSDKNRKIFEKIGYDRYSNEYWSPSPGSEGIIINECVSGSGKEYVLFKCLSTNRLSVVNKSVIESFNIDFFKYSKNRIKIGKLAKNILSSLDIVISNKEVEEFVNLFKASYDILNNKDSMFRLVSGDEIAHWYNFENYYSDYGTLGNSCMSRKEPDFFEIYTTNKNCKLLILLSDDGELRGGEYNSNKIVGRALVWTGNLMFDGKLEKEIIVMDRVYTNYDSDVEVFIEYSKRMGWYHKTRQSSSCEPISSNNESIIFYNNSINKFTCEFIIPLENYILEKYPYIDTFYYLMDNYLSNVLNISEPEVEHGNRYFRSTEGNFNITQEVDEQVSFELPTNYDDNLEEVEYHDEVENFGWLD
jgi:hypothetical protein